MRTAQLQPLLIFLIVLSLAYFCGQMVVANQYEDLVVLCAIVALMGFGMFSRTEHLLYLTSYVLLAGSSYDVTMRRLSFYFRFGVMSLYLLRLLSLWSKPADYPGLPPDRLRFTPVHLLVIFFSILAMMSSSYSIDGALTFQRSVAISILFGAVFLYLYWISSTWELMEKYFAILVRSTNVLLVVGFLAYLLGVEQTIQSTGRLRLFFFGPNELGYVCAILFPGAFWYYSTVQKKGFGKFFAGLGVALFIIALILTGSRGSLICFVLSGFFLVLFSYRRKLVMFLVAAFFGLSVLMIFAPPDTDNLKQVLDSKIIRSDTLQSGSGRIPIWKHGWELVQQRPLLGFGFGTVGTLFFRGYFSEVVSDFQGASLHNSYLEMMLDLGYLGTVPIILALLFIFFRGFAMVIKLTDHPQQPFAAAVFCCFFSGLTSAIFESWMTSPGSLFSFPFWFSAALLLRMPQLLERSG